MVISTNTGRVYRPKDCERLIVYLKDLNLPKPDKWGTSQLIAFLQQVPHNYINAIIVYTGHGLIQEEGGPWDFPLDFFSTHPPTHPKKFQH